MKRLHLFIVPFFLFTPKVYSESKYPKPNVILILIDDLGWKDLGCMGSTFYETPNVDQLSREGVLFTSAYAANPVCSPTRASILTGKYPSRINLTNHSGTPGPNGPAYRLNPPELVGNMPLGDITLAEALKDGGYSTDLYPTILEMLDLPLRPQQHLDGVSLKSLITGESKHLEREAIYFHYPHYHQVNTMGPAGAIRMGDYKLVERFENMKVELFNLKNDIGETKDLSDEMPELTEKMKMMLHQWRKTTGSRMPEVNKDFNDSF